MASATEEKMTATEKVMGTLDLFEDIILRLPLTEVLLVQGVCKPWQHVHQESPRIQRVLFFKPGTERKMFYPDCNKPAWFMTPDRSQLIEAGLVSEPLYDSDTEGDVTPTNSPIQPKSDSSDKENKPPSKRVTTHGKQKSTVLSDTVGTLEEGGDDGGISLADDTELAWGVAAAGDKQVTNGIKATQKHNTCRDVILYNPNSHMNDDYSDFETADPNVSPNTINIFRWKLGECDPTYILGNIYPKIPKSMDGLMWVPRVTPPFINPFFEIFFERYYRGTRGGFYPAGGNSTYDLVVRPQEKNLDGSTKGRSRKTRAVTRRDASWRKMHPFSALTASIAVECFDFGNFEVFCDWGMLAGSMMDQLGEHWGNICPECCIPDFWFSELIKEVCYTDGSWCNRGKHGVRRIGINHTGWEVLGRLNRSRVRLTDIKEYIRPY
jgi:hypothetical protein